MDTKGFLVELAQLRDRLSLQDMPYNVASLRTNALKPYREGRQCALFCYGMGRLMGREVRFAQAEDADVDFVGRYEVDGTAHYVPIQMKEVVPAEVRVEVSLQQEIDKLAKYVDSQDLTVVFHVIGTSASSRPRSIAHA